MSKVTYEEAKNSNSVLKELITEGYKTINNFPLEQYFIHEENVEHFIEQYRPPTFDEVVKAWEEHDYQARLIDNESGTRIQIDYSNGMSFRIYRTGAIAFAGGWNFYEIEGWFTRAINLTIRYLESQKEGKEHEEN